MISQLKHQTFKVFIRCRPLNEKQSMFGASKRSVSINQPSIINLTDSDGRQNSFNFDYVFNQQFNNQEVFNKTVQPLIQHFMNGYNSTVFAYGITGAGKSFTMFGNYYKSNSTPGLIPLTFKYLLNSIDIKQCKLKMSYIEIYNEQIFDLLKDQSQNLHIIQDPQKGVLVQDLQERKVNDLQEISQLITDGNNRRVMAQTNANDFSSRSHAIVLITLQRKIDQKTVIAKLSLVDLAGSQKASVHQGKGIRILQGSNINKSLLALGNCINSLSDNSKKNGFVPYRDSKLTRLLKDSLGGNTKTVMIGCISQSILFHDQTLNTLKYAARAKKIEKIVHQNIKQSNSIEYYKQQIEKLKRQNQLLKLSKKNTSLLKLKQKKIKIQNIVANLVQTLRNCIFLEQKIKINNDKHVLKLLNHKFKQKQFHINTLISISLQQDNLSLLLPQSNIIYKKSPPSPKIIRPKSSFKQKQNKLPLQLQQMRSKVKKTNRYISNLSIKGLKQSQIDLNRNDYMIKPIKSSQSQIFDFQKFKIPNEGKTKKQQFNFNTEPCIINLNKCMKRSKHLDSLKQIQKINQKLAQFTKIKNSTKQYKKSNMNIIENDNQLQII